MTSDLGSRHAPNIYINTAEASINQELNNNPPKKAELEWLCQIIGCKMPNLSNPANDSSTTTAPSEPTPSSQPPSHSPLPPPANLRVTLTDGRIYTGQLHCVDSSANLILSNVNQAPTEIEGVPVGGFQMGHTLIAWKYVQKVEMQQQQQQQP